MITGISVFSEENSEENHYFTVFFTSGENCEENPKGVKSFFQPMKKKLEKHEVIPVRIEQCSFSQQ